MKNIKIVGGVLFSLLIIFGAYINGTYRSNSNLIDKNVFGDSVVNATQSTTTDSSFGVGTTFKVLACGEGSLENVNITFTSNAPLQLFDGTTTAAHSSTASTTLADFKTTTVGSYKFNSRFSRGLILAMPSVVGVASSTITYNGNYNGGSGSCI